MNDQVNHLDYEPRPQLSVAIAPLIPGCVARSTIAAVAVLAWGEYTTFGGADLGGIALVGAAIGIGGALTVLTIALFDRAVGHPPMPTWFRIGLSYFVGLFPAWVLAMSMSVR